MRVLQPPGLGTRAAADITCHLPQEEDARPGTPVFRPVCPPPGVENRFSFLVHGVDSASPAPWNLPQQKPFLTAPPPTCTHTPAAPTESKGLEAIPQCHHLWLKSHSFKTLVKITLALPPSQDPFTCSPCPEQLWGATQEPSAACRRPPLASGSPSQPRTVHVSAGHQVWAIDEVQCTVQKERLAKRLHPLSVFPFVCELAILSYLG